MPRAPTESRPPVLRLIYEERLNDHNYGTRWHPRIWSPF